MSTDADQFLMGGVTSAKFDNINDSITGTISEPPEVRQQTDIDTKLPMTWPDGRPMMQLVVTLQTDLRNDADDDGLRRIYVKGKSMTGAVRDAVRKAGAKGLEVGGRLQVVYVGDGEVKKRGFNPPKLYLAQYARPTTQEANAFLGLTPPAPQQAPSPIAGGNGFQQQPQAAPPF
jgi:hypothetical protein